MLGMDRRLEAGVAALQGTVLDKAVEKGLISNLSVKMKTLSISDIYKEELVN